jgi:AcrR family transcriptional regulator
MPAARRRDPARRYRGVSADDRVAARRERLLDAALELYGTRGFATTGVKDVCRTAGLTDRYFYESFRDSGELYVATLDRTTAELLALVGRRVAQAPPEPGAQARAAIDAFVRALAADPRTARLIFADTASANPEVEQHMRATLRRFAALVADTARPHLPEDVPEQTLRIGALAVVGAIERVMIEWQDGELDATIDQLVDHLVQIFSAVGTSVGWQPPDETRGSGTV